MNTAKLKVVVMLFSLSCGALSFYSIMGVRFTPNTQKLQVDQVSVPAHFQQSGDAESLGLLYVDDETYQHISAFRYYMDSLKRHQRVEYDSILAARPELMDSMAALETIYHQQKQNSTNEK